MRHNHKFWSLHLGLGEGFPDDAMEKNLPANAGFIGDVSTNPGLGRSPGR